MIEFRMPSLGADMESGFLREWRVKPGDHVNRGDIIAEVETQKGIIEIEVFDEGVVGELLIKVDEKVPVGTIMTHILEKNEAPPKPETSTVEVAKATVPPLEKTSEPVAPVHHTRASPLAKRIAREKGIDLLKIKGSGLNGAILREDVEKALVEQAVPSDGKSVSENVRMAVAAAMSKSNREIPHYYLQTKADMSRALRWLSALNKQRSVRDRILPVVLMIKAVARALKDVPDLNAWWENELHLKTDINIGFAVSRRSGGIIVPAIHDVGNKSLDDLAKALADIIPRARALKLRSSELADSTITITSLGEGEVEAVYGVIYPPQVAIVGLGAITDEPWAEQGMIGVKPIATITLAADHRATDGKIGSRFLTAVKKYLNQPEEL